MIIFLVRAKIQIKHNNNSSNNSRHSKTNNLIEICHRRHSNSLKVESMKPKTICNLPQTWNSISKIFTVFKWSIVGDWFETVTANDSKKAYNNGPSRNYDMDDDPSLNQVRISNVLWKSLYTAINVWFSPQKLYSIKMLHKTVNSPTISNHHLNKISTWRTNRINRIITNQTINKLQLVKRQVDKKTSSSFFWLFPIQFHHNVHISIKSH